MINPLDVKFEDHRLNETELFICDRMHTHHVLVQMDGTRQILASHELNGPMEYRPFGIYDVNGWELWPSDCKALSQANNAPRNVEKPPSWLTVEEDDMPQPKQSKKKKKG